MKSLRRTLSLVTWLSAWLAISPSIARAQASATYPPRLTVLERIQTEVEAEGPPKFVRDRQGNPVFVTITRDPESGALMRLSAFGSGSKILAELTVKRPGKSSQYLLLDHVEINPRGEIIAVTNLNDRGVLGHQLLSHNLNRGTTVELVNSDHPASFMGRIEFAGRTLVAVSEDLQRRFSGGGADPFRIRVIDERSGEVVLQRDLDHPFSGTFHVDRSGQLKMLLMGYELFGVLDVQSNSWTELLPSRKQPSVYPGLVHLSIGDFVQFTDKASVRLFKAEDLAQGRVIAVRRFPKNTSFVGGERPSVAATQTRDGIMLTDLATGRALGPQIPKAETRNPREGATVADVRVGSKRTVAVLTEAKNPDSYLPGIILTYVDVKTGRILRRRSEGREQLHASVVELPDGRMVAVERPLYLQEIKTIPVIDLATNREISVVPRDEWNSAPFFSAGGDLLQLRAKSDNELCVSDLLAPARETCLNDPLIKGAVHYGYEPFSLNNGKVVLPLLGERNNWFYPTRGFVEIRVD